MAYKKTMDRLFVPPLRTRLLDIVGILLSLAVGGGALALMVFGWSHAGVFDWISIVLTVVGGLVLYAGLVILHQILTPGLIVTPESIKRPGLFGGRRVKIGPGTRLGRYDAKVVRSVADPMSSTRSKMVSFESSQLWGQSPGGKPRELIILGRRSPHTDPFFDDVAAMTGITPEPISPKQGALIVRPDFSDWR